MNAIYRVRRGRCPACLAEADELLEIVIRPGEQPRVEPTENDLGLCAGCIEAVGAACAARVRGKRNG